MIDIDTASSANILGDAIRRLSDTRLALAAGADAAKKGVQRNFDQERSGKGPWKDLEKSTIKDRRKVNLGPKPILYRGGKYLGDKKPGRILRETFDQDSPLELDDEKAVIGSKDFRVEFLAKDRPIVALQKDDERAVFDAMTEKLTRG